METTETVYVLSSVWTTVSYGDTTKTEKVFESKLDAAFFISSFDPASQNMAAHFVSMRIEAVHFVKIKV